MRRAFTLIELIVIIVIISVTAGILVPRFTDYYQRAKFSGVVRDIRDLLAEAHDRAVTLDTSTIVTFDPGSQLFDLQVTPPLPLTDLPSALAEEAQSVSAGEHRGYTLREDFTVSQFRPLTQPASTASPKAAEGVTFHSDGTGDGVEVVVSSAFGFGAKITVSPSTGQTIVEEQ